jgi:hypothetical protein
LYKVGLSALCPTPSNPEKQWFASSSGFSLPTYLAQEALPGALLPLVQLGGPLKDTSPTTICQGQATSQQIKNLTFSIIFGSIMGLPFRMHFCKPVM